MNHTPTPWTISRPNKATEGMNECANVRGIHIWGQRMPIACIDEATHIVECVNAFGDCQEPVAAMMAVKEALRLVYQYLDDDDEIKETAVKALDLLSGKNAP